MKRAFSHVGIYVGNGKFIHSPKPGAEVRVEDMGGSYWARRFDGARRVPVGSTDLSAAPAPAEAEPDTPLLWVLREQLGLTGTKYGCGIAQCGACTVHIDGVPGAQLRAAGVQRRPANEKITTIEGLSPDGSTRCRRPGWRWTCRSAATARAA
jgi:hypothetical protein